MRLLPLVLLFLLSSLVGVAQTFDEKRCANVRLAASITVKGFTFKTYEGVDDSPSYVKVFKDRKLVFRIADGDREYYLTAPSSAPIQVISNPLLHQERIVIS